MRRAPSRQISSSASVNSGRASSSATTLNIGVTFLTGVSPPALVFVQRGRDAAPQLRWPIHKFWLYLVAEAAVGVLLGAAGGLHDAVKADELADDESHVVLDDARSAKSSLTPGCRPGRRSGLRSRESAPRGGNATWCGRGRWARPPTASRGVVMSGPAPRTALRRRNRVLSAVTVVLLGPVAPLAVAATTPPASPTPGRHDATTGRALPAFRPPAPNAYLRRLALAGTPVAPPPRRLAASQLAFVF